MSTINDLTFLALGDLGYTGSIQDRQFAYLKDQSGLTGVSVADMQKALSLHVGELINVGILVGGLYPTSNLYPSNNLTPRN